ncbi:hypothetical protein MASS_2879 [Mycobacteroides abscessus subsp. bolletii 50594]|uniref:Uncharacterized protein n=1 Tax=Mycobacteroides abscessus subsp. bolletii 50594 TaxID=1303024 RepID=A0AB33ACQ2_9MYCO|nr:hypothetical protein MASS_2879 [Mycobacteroides abscessus subsp. bolletii 50594]
MRRFINRHRSSASLRAILTTCDVNMMMAREKADSAGKME